MGNRTALTDTSGTHTYSYDAANRLTHMDNITYTWDMRGNLRNDGVTTYTYDGAGRMVQAQNVTLTLVYTYNADGLRVAQDVSGTTTAFVWDWATPVPEMLYDGDNVYLVGLDTVGWWDGEAWTFALPDALGSVRQETNISGTVTASREWSPFGVAMDGAQAGLGYTGEWWDEGAGLLYLRARWYDARTGRFTQRDALMMSPLYHYASDNPVNRIDPSGYIDWAACTIQGDLGTCTIQTGDRLYEIAREINAAGVEARLSDIVADIIVINGLQDNPNYIRIGESLRLRANWIVAVQQSLAQPTPFPSPIAPTLLPENPAAGYSEQGSIWLPAPDMYAYPISDNRVRWWLSEAAKIAGHSSVDFVLDTDDFLRGKPLLPPPYDTFYDIGVQLAADAQLNICIPHRATRTALVTVEQAYISGGSVAVGTTLSGGAVTLLAPTGNVAFCGIGLVGGWAIGYVVTYHVFLSPGFEWANEEFLFPALYFVFEDNICPYANYIISNVQDGN